MSLITLGLPGYSLLSLFVQTYKILSNNEFIESFLLKSYTHVHFQCTEIKRSSIFAEADFLLSVSHITRHSPNLAFNVIGMAGLASNLKVSQAYSLHGIEQGMDVVVRGLFVES